MKLLTAAETSGRLRLSKSGVSKLVRLGQLPAVRIGRRVLFDEADLAAFIAARRTGGPVDDLAVARGGR